MNGKKNPDKLDSYDRSAFLIPTLQSEQKKRRKRQEKTGEPDPHLRSSRQGVVRFDEIKKAAGNIIPSPLIQFVMWSILLIMTLAVVAYTGAWLPWLISTGIQLALLFLVRTIVLSRVNHLKYLEVDAWGSSTEKKKHIRESLLQRYFREAGLFWIGMLSIIFFLSWGEVWSQMQAIASLGLVLTATGFRARRADDAREKEKDTLRENYRDRNATTAAGRRR